jgi:hypothetical protein
MICNREHHDYSAGDGRGQSTEAVANEDTKPVPEKSGLDNPVVEKPVLGISSR